VGIDGKVEIGQDVLNLGSLVKVQFANHKARDIKAGKGSVGKTNLPQERRGLYSFKRFSKMDEILRMR